MTRGKDKANSEPKEQKLDWSADFTGYVNFQPTEGQKEEFALWLEGKDYWEQLDQQTALGRKLAVALDPKQECYVATCMERDTRSVNAGLVCSARGSTSEMAVWRLLWYVSSALPYNWKSGLKKNAADLW
jgi:hypothetical protein